MLMKREPYVVPQLSIVEAFVERGFTASIDEWVDDESSSIGTIPRNPIDL